VIEVLQKNVRLAQSVIVEGVARLPEHRECPCAGALKDAIITERSLIPTAVREELAPIIGRYL
jgi:5'-methylthioadenosine phosphorylase